MQTLNSWVLEAVVLSIFSFEKQKLESISLLLSANQIVVIVLTHMAILIAVGKLNSFSLVIFILDRDLYVEWLTC